MTLICIESNVTSTHLQLYITNFAFSTLNKVAEIQENVYVFVHLLIYDKYD